MQLRKIFTLWFVLLALLFVIHQLLQKVFNVSFPVIDSYLDPLLFMPMLLHLMLWERRWLFRKGLGYTLPLLDIFSIFLVASVVCEGIFPYFKEEFIADLLDVVAYFLGALLFAFFFK